MKPRPEFSHPVHEVIRKRWSPRLFSDRPVSEEQVLTLFEAASWAASAMNEQPWRFIWSLKDGSEKYKKLFSCLYEGNQIWASSAPLLILTLAKTTFSFNGKPNPWSSHDLGLAVGNLTTQASLMDLFVHNMGGFDRQKAREIFSLTEDLEPITMIAVGWAEDPENLSEQERQREYLMQKRRSLQDIFL
ncbi:MAG: nitroreductase family protein [Candidatus Cloacimonadota bacterium]|nr:nitroreductase family protein [Candidatus Cloacimonadota bacterium]